MNNYQFTRDYYNYENNNYNIQNYEQSINKENIYDPYNGLIRGNLFPDLYNPYKLDNPIQIKPMNEQAELLTYINALDFACIDLALYLDVNPNNSDAIDMYNMYRSNLGEYMVVYQKKFGPLTKTSDSLNSYPWKWNNSPWPWEGEL